MGISFDVQVLDSDDEPVAGVEVTALFPSFPMGGVTLEEYTDAEGHASFETAGDHHGDLKAGRSGLSQALSCSITLTVRRLGRRGRRDQLMHQRRCARRG
jgi:hypothetical protein